MLNTIANKVTAGLILGTGLFGVGEIVPDLSPWAQLGSVGVLAWVARVLVAELRESRTDAAKMRAEYSASFSASVERAEKWEQIRHADSMALQETIRQMTANCASVSARPRKEA